MVDSPQADESDSPESSESRLGDRPVIDDQGLSLDALSQAYAELIGKGADPYEPPEPSAPDEQEVQVDEEETIEDDSCDLCPSSILEAILFVGHPTNEPIDAEQIASIMRGVPAREIHELVKDLNTIYREQEHPFHIVSVGAGYRLELRDEFAALRNVFYGRVREARLSQASIDVLAIIAYQQGRSRQEIDTMRGRPSGGLLSQLVRRRLLRIEWPQQKPRVPRYFTTDRFLELFGLSSLQDLPHSQDNE